MIASEVAFQNMLADIISHSLFTHLVAQNSVFTVAPQALFATLLISIAPLLLLFILPIVRVDPKNKKKRIINQPLLNVLLAFAVGGLLGDSLLHLLPHSFDPHTHSHAVITQLVSPVATPAETPLFGVAAQSTPSKLSSSSNPRSAISEDHTHLQHDHSHSKSHSHSHSHSHAHGDKHEHGHKHSHSSNKHSHGSHNHNHNHDKHSHSDHTHHDEHVHDHSRGLRIGLFVLSGILLFFLIERIFHTFSLPTHSHSHSHGETHVEPLPPSSSPSSPSSASLRRRSRSATRNHVEDSDLPTRSNSQQLSRRVHSDPQSNSSHADSIESTSGDQLKRSSSASSTSSSGIPNSNQSATLVKRRRNSSSHRDSERLRIAAILNLLLDFSHNFTDGMAIGASFLASKNIAFATVLSVLFHEVPHEVGDYAILISAGFSQMSAIRSQLLTALGAFFGCFVGLFFSGVGEKANEWILPFTAGGFVYVACVAILPTLLRKTGVWQLIAEMSAMLVGISFMVVIAVFE